MIKVTPEFVKPYFNGTKKSPHYWSCLDIYYHNSFHFDGYVSPLYNAASATGFDQYAQNYFNQDEDPRRFNPYFFRLIDMRRPSESDAIKAYRRNIYLPFTKMQCFKVYNSLRKIVKSPDWKIDYSKSERPPSVPDGMALEDYCERQFPGFRSIENWIYSYAFRHMLVDPNGAVLILPESIQDRKEYNIDQSVPPSPYAQIICSADILDFKEGHLLVYKESEYKDKDYVNPKIKALHVVTTEGVWKVTASDRTADNLLVIQTHKFETEVFPAIRLGGTVCNYKHGMKIYESFLAPMLPGLDACAREVSDADAEVVQHIFSTMWYYAVQNCNNCQGTGKVMKEGKQAICTSCEGNGSMAKSPYKDMVLKQGSFDSEKMPTPPAGYITKQTDMVKLMQERINGHIKYALSSINMEYLSDVPLAQSGTAKEVDRDELNNFVYGIAYHLVEGIVNPVYRLVNELRYAVLVPNEKLRAKMLPFIPVPEKFDLLTAAVLEQQLNNARTAKADPIIINQYEIDLVNKQFSSDPTVREKIVLAKQLDPFPGYTPEEKQNLKLAKSAVLSDIIISIYINSFIERAMVEEKDFMHKELKDKQKVMQKYAKEKQNLISDSAILEEEPDPEVREDVEE